MKNPRFYRGVPFFSNAVPDPKESIIMKPVQFFSSPRKITSISASRRRIPSALLCVRFCETVHFRVKQQNAEGSLVNGGWIYPLKIAVISKSPASRQWRGAGLLFCSVSGQFSRIKPPMCRLFSFAILTSYSLSAFEKIVSNHAA